MNTESSLAAELKIKEYRDAFVASQLRIGLPMQCRALRESRGWTQPQLAEIAGMSQPRISEIERPGERRLNLETLLRLASAFDVALQVRFVPFSKFVDDDDSIDLNSFYVDPYEEDMARLLRLEEQMTSVSVMNAGLASRLAGQGQLQTGLTFSASTPSQSDQQVLSVGLRQLDDSSRGVALVGTGGQRDAA